MPESHVAVFLAYRNSLQANAAAGAEEAPVVVAVKGNDRHAGTKDPQPCHDSAQVWRNPVDKFIPMRLE